MTKTELLKIAKPILFNTEMTRAILDGRKTVTRRVIKGLPDNVYSFERLSDDGIWEYRWGECGRGICLDFSNIITPKYQVGDYLYVRETWADVFGKYEYRADYSESENTYRVKRYGTTIAKWRPSIHMPKEAARIFLRVKNVRVERLQEITLEDIEHEGLYCEPPYTNEHYAYAPGMRIHWIKLWDSLNAKRGYGWDTNPWVWVYEFEKVAPK